MIRKIEVAGNCLAELMIAMIVITVEIVLMIDFMEQAPDLKLILLQAAVPLLFYFLREKCSFIVLFFLLHGLSVWGSFTLAGNVLAEKVIFGIGTMVFAALSIYKMLGRGEKSMPAPHPFLVLLFFFICYLVDAGQMNGDAGVYLLQLATIYFSFWFLYYFLKKFVTFMNINHLFMEGIPIKKVFVSASILSLGFSTLSYLIINLCTNKELWDAVGVRFAGWVKGILGQLFSLMPETEAPTGNGLIGVEDIGDFGNASSEVSRFAEIADMIVRLLGDILLVVLLILAMAALIRLIRKAFQWMKKKGGLQWEEPEDQIEVLDRKKEKKAIKKENPRHIFSGTPQQKIRKLYYKTLIKKHHVLKEEKTEKLLRYGTARECMGEMFADMQEKAGSCAKLYEKARYGRENCTAEDVKEMKALALSLMKNGR